jgi:hypothetical protein
MQRAQKRQPLITRTTRIGCDGLDAVGVAIPTVSRRTRVVGR